MSTPSKTLNDHRTSDDGLLKYSRVFRALATNKAIDLPAVSGTLYVCPKGIHAGMFHSDRQEFTAGGYLTFHCHFASWDEEHFLFIAAQEYTTDAGRCVFYPLLLLTIRYFSITSGTIKLVEKMIVAKVFSLAVSSVLPRLSLVFSIVPGLCFSCIFIVRSNDRILE